MLVSQIRQMNIQMWTVFREDMQKQLKDIQVVSQQANNNNNNNGSNYQNMRSNVGLYSHRRTAFSATANVQINPFDNALQNNNLQAIEKVIAKNSFMIDNGEDFMIIDLDTIKEF